MKPIWKSQVSNEIKRKMFRATVESVLIYDSFILTLTEHLEPGLSGVYARMLRSVLDISLKQHPTNQRMYGNLQDLIIIIRKKRIRFAGQLAPQGRTYRRPATLTF